ncbi:hypothetical protein [Paraburkholderia sp. Cy-641]|uniref:hypothetical protein n=1 Tax=Paraburkholderia sp. Cy-641 TaxID=2608337 RepID=UPI001421FB7C|nr:hypothetical protein [Paraburkholderia sp. Cy-641]
MCRGFGAHCDAARTARVQECSKDCESLLAARAWVFVLRCSVGIASMILLFGRLIPGQSKDVCLSGILARTACFMFETAHKHPAHCLL